MNSFGTRFGALVKQRRGVEGLTQQELAVLAFHEESSKARISELENGRVPNPRQRTVDALVVALNLSAADLASCRKPSVPELPDGFLATIGITAELVEALSWNFGLENPKASDLEYKQFLRNKVAELAQLQARIGALGEANERISNIMTAAQHEINQGQFDVADELLDSAEEIQQEEHTLAQVRKQADIRATRASAALLKGDAERAFSHYHRAAEFFAPFDQYEGGKMRTEYGQTLFRHGFSYGGTALLRAVELFEVNLSAFSDPEHASALGDTYWRIGTCRSFQGLRTAGAQGIELLDAAIAACETARNIAVQVVDVVAQSKAETTLGSALWHKGQREHGEAGLTLIADAVSAFHRALECCPREVHPPEWARAQVSLGLALQHRGRRMGGNGETQFYLRAIEAYEAALKVYTYDADPFHWAITKINLGISLRVYGERSGDEDRSSYFERAVAVFEEATIEFSQEERPLGWASIQMNLGITLMFQGTLLSSSTARQEKIADASSRFDAALEVQNREIHSLEWAQTKHNMGVATNILAAHETGSMRERLLRQALDDVDAALEVFDPKTESHFHSQATKTKSEIMIELSGIN